MSPDRELRRVLVRRLKGRRSLNCEDLTANVSVLKEWITRNKQKNEEIN